MKRWIVFLSQTYYYNMEVIVIDDASVDGSREGYWHNDDRIDQFSGKNRHVCYAGNEGFKLACGKYVAVIGHDDVSGKQTKWKKQITFLEEHPI